MSGSFGIVRRGAAVPAVLLLAVLGGCSDDAAQDPVDAARLAAAQALPLLAGASAEPASTDVGSAGYDWRRSELSRRTPSPLPDAAAQREVVRALVVDAAGDGWQLRYTACGEADDAGAVVAELVRPITTDPGGASAVLARLATEPAGDGHRLSVRAVLPYHAQDAGPMGLAAPTLDPQDTCLAASAAEGAATDGAPVDLDQFGPQPAAG